MDFMTSPAVVYSSQLVDRKPLLEDRPRPVSAGRAFAPGSILSETNAPRRSSFRPYNRQMGFRFYRRIRLFPGLRLNLSKSGVSTSIGGRDHWLTLGRRDAQATVGQPGTGSL